MLKSPSIPMACFVASLPGAYAGIGFGDLVARLVSAPDFAPTHLLAMFFTAFVLTAPMTVFVLPVVLATGWGLAWPVIRYMPRINAFSLSAIGAGAGSLIGTSLGYVEAGATFNSSDVLVFGSGGLAAGTVFAWVVARLRGM